MRDKPYEGALSAASSSELRDLECWWFSKMRKESMLYLAYNLANLKLVQAELNKRGRKKVK